MGIQWLHTRFKGEGAAAVFGPALTRDTGDVFTTGHQDCPGLWLLHVLVDRSRYRSLNSMAGSPKLAILSGDHPGCRPDLDSTSSVPVDPVPVFST